MDLTTTTARAFVLTRRDGSRQGFTDHDLDLIVDGVTCSAGAALTASDTATKLGLSPDDLDASGALSTAAITESDISAGAYDGAEVAAYDVDWTTDAATLLGRYRLGQIERGPLAFRAELRGLSAALDAKAGRVHGVLCDADRLGDGRCGLALGPWQDTGATVTAVDGLTVTLSGPSRASGFFDKGTLDWTGGANAGDGSDIRTHRADGSATVVTLWRAPARAMAVGNVATLTAGCDRSGPTCRNTFANYHNFRGFPFMPGAQFAGAYALPGDPDQTGGSRFE